MLLAACRTERRKGQCEPRRTSGVATNYCGVSGLPGGLPGGEASKAVDAYGLVGPRDPAVRRRTGIHSD